MGSVYQGMSKPVKSMDLMSSTVTLGACPPPARHSIPDHLVLHGSVPFAQRRYAGRLKALFISSNATTSEGNVDCWWIRASAAPLGIASQAIVRAMFCAANASHESQNSTARVDVASPDSTSRI